MSGQCVCVCVNVNLYKYCFVCFVFMVSAFGLNYWMLYCISEVIDEPEVHFLYT